MKIIGILAIAIVFISVGTYLLIRAMKIVKQLNEKFIDDERMKNNIGLLNACIMVLYMFMVMGIVFTGGWSHINF